VSISDKTRKTLWAKAGGRCSICRQQLVTDAEAADDEPSVFGEECHIVARSPGGPRAGQIEDEDPDGYRNLILLCRKHHKQVDDQPAHFTVERLRQLKRDHEEQEAARSGSIRLIPDPTKPTPKLLTVCVTGETLWSHLSGSHSFNPSWPGSLDDAQGDAVADVATEMSYSEGRSAAKELGERLKELVGLGLFVGVRQRHLMLAGGASEPTRWRSFDIQFQRVTEADLAHENRTPYAASAT
jgi:hypothetical protein